MPVHEIANYRYRGARALVLLHEQELRRLLPVWYHAKAADLRLPKTEDPDYASLETLLHHVLRSARGYMTWMCGKLGLPDPGIDAAPEAMRVEQDAARWTEHLLALWRLPLAGIEEPRFNETFETRWGVDMSIESMLEHAVLHPMRHRFQLEELMEKAP
jgi:uncharacterized damage-inducible protein DinB